MFAGLEEPVPKSDELPSVQCDRTPRMKLWDGVTADRWNDWRWQLANRIGALEEIGEVLRLTPDEEAGIRLGSRRLRLEVTPYFASLMDPDDPACPIRRQIIPTVAELNA